MDRKKTIVAAVMINAGILTVLFIAAMTMREEPVQLNNMGHLSPATANDPKPLFKEGIEIPAQVPLAFDASPSTATPPVAFSLPPLALVEQKPTPAIPEEISAASLVAAPAPVMPQFLSAAEIEVQKGDNLEKIAKRCHTSVDELIKLNQLPSSFLKVGQRLKIPEEKSHGVTKAPPLSTASEHAEYYTMKVGDNPWSIAMKHHIKVDELLKLNGLNDKTARKLKPGDRLRIK